MKPDTTRRLIGGAAILIGLVWAGQWIFLGLDGILSHDRGWAIALVGLPMVILFAVPGIWSIKSGFQLYRQMQVETLKRVVGLGAVMGGIFVSGLLFGLIREVFPDREIVSGIILFLVSFMMILVYLVTVRFLLRYLAEKTVTCRSLLGRPLLIVMAWILCFGLFEAFDEFAVDRAGLLYLDEMTWMTVGYVGSIVVSWAIYHFVADRLLSEESPDDDPRQTSTGESS